MPVSFAMRPIGVVELLLLQIWITNAYAVWFGSLFECNKHVCSWFCDQNLPFVERTTSGGFKTEFLTSIVHQPLKNQQHTIFTIAGAQAHCLQLSLQCAGKQRSSASSTPKGQKSRVLLLNFRCEHFIATYEAHYEETNNCYEIYIHEMAHIFLARKSLCQIPYAKHYRIESDGKHFLLVSKCLNVVRERKPGSVAYWLFVNKGNTPEQNRRIIRQLPLPEAITNQMYERSTGNDSTSKGACRCYLFERYIRAIKRCNKPFLGAIGHRENVRQFQTSKGKGAKVASTSGFVAISKEEALLALLLLFSSSTFGVLFCVVYLHYRRYMEELL